MDLAGLGKLINLESVTMLCYSCCNCCNSITRQSPTLGTWLYRVAHLLANLGWVDHDLNCSTLWLVMPRLMGNWQKWLGKMVEHPKTKSTQPRFVRRWATRTR